MLTEGDKAPIFALNDSEGNKIGIDSFPGQKKVLYFYPKDNTPGCTKEACSFRDVYDEILALGAVVIGISPDKQSSHEKFKAKHGLPFYLLSDEEHLVAEQYDVWKEKKMFGKTYMGIIRTTFIIDEEGTIIKIYPKVTPKEHGNEVLKFLQPEEGKEEQ